MGAGAAVIIGREDFPGRETQEGSCVGYFCSGGQGRDGRRGGVAVRCRGGVAVKPSL
jgi:hypothetical protein